MNTLLVLIKRNVKLFFKDRGMFFTSLVTPIILLVLYSTFLGNVYRDSFVSTLPVSVSDELLDALVAGQLVSSILAVSSVTVSFCSNFLMVQDKANGTRRDLTVAPVRSRVLSMSYYFATLISTLTICLTATLACLLYMYYVGWYLSALDAFLIILDVLVLVLFGTALSSVISFFLSSQGQISAVGTVISAGYGFICGAYMPISSFSKGLQKVLSFLPGTYGTSLLRTHTLGGALDELSSLGVPVDAIDSIKSGLDCTVSFFGKEVTVPTMYTILASSTFILVATYVVMNAVKKKI